jgi:hypothetical protein
LFFLGARFQRFSHDRISGSYLQTKQISAKPIGTALDSSLLTGATPVVRNRCHVFDQLHVQTGRLQRSDRTFASGTGALHADFNVTHSELRRFLSRLLGSTLTSEGSAFATSFESAGSSAGPAQSVTLVISNGYGRVVESSADMGNTAADVSANTFFLIGLCHSKGPGGFELVGLKCDVVKQHNFAN